MPKRQKHTIFVLDGSIRHYEGSMLELYSQITVKEWKLIVEETIKYSLFVECLKDVGCPDLNEPWEDQDEYFRKQLNNTVSKIKDIDPILVSKYDQQLIKQSYAKQMRNNASEFLKYADQVRAEHRLMLAEKYGLNGETKVSNL